MKNQKLESIQIERDLGVLISSDLKASQQCQQAYAKASKALGMINRTITNKSTKILLQLYKSLVRPHLEYCTTAWYHYQKDKAVGKGTEALYTYDTWTKEVPIYDTVEACKIVDIGRQTNTSRPDRGL